MNSHHSHKPTADFGGGHKRKNDVIFISALLAGLILLGMAVYLLPKEGDTVTVTIYGEVFGTYSLNQDARIDITAGNDGTVTHRLVIQNGVAYVESATCPDGVCVDHWPISRQGQSIACLPYGLIVAIERHDNGSEPVPDIIV